MANQYLNRRRRRRHHFTKIPIFDYYYYYLRTSNEICIKKTRKSLAIYLDFPRLFSYIKTPTCKVKLLIFRKVVTIFNSHDDPMSCDKIFWKLFVASRGRESMTKHCARPSTSCNRLLD